MSSRHPAHSHWVWKRSKEDGHKIIPRGTSCVTRPRGEKQPLLISREFGVLDTCSCYHEAIPECSHENCCIRTNSLLKATNKGFQQFSCSLHTWISLTDEAMIVQYLYKPPILKIECILDTFSPAGSFASCISFPWSSSAHQYVVCKPPSYSPFSNSATSLSWGKVTI